MNIFPCHAIGVWQCEFAGQCSTNFTLPDFGILLRDSQLPGNPKEGIGLADPRASSSSASSSSTSAAAAKTTVTVTAAADGGIVPSNDASSSPPTITTSSSNAHALAVGLGVGIPLGLLLLVACTALLFQRQRKLKEERAVGAPLNGSHEKSKRRGYWGIYRNHHNDHDVPELHEHRAVPELRDNNDEKVKSVHELGGQYYMPGMPPPPPPPLLSR